MEQLKAILVDDEKSSLENLKQKLLEFCPDVNILAMADKPEEAIVLIRQHKPDVIFLDIEMPRMSGIRMLDELPGYTGEIIFTTAYNHYAIDAIRISAFDYLVKPVSISELQNSVVRLVKYKQTETRERLDILRQSLSNTKSQDDKIAVPTGDGLEFLQIKNIIHIESSANYSRIFLNDGKSMLVTKLLKDFDDILLPYRFYRVHNSHLINLNYIQKYIRGDGGQVVLQNGDVVDVSRRKKDEFLRLISN
jgi:two-component system, LytTR family, response regulator